MIAASRITLIMLLWMAGAAAPGFAHPLDPALLDIRESSADRLDVVWRWPMSRTAERPLQVVLPDGCDSQSTPEMHQSGSRVTLRWHAQCEAGGLVGRRVGVAGLRERQTDALLRLQLADGRLIQAVLRGDSPTIRVPARSGRLSVLRDYLRLGFGHILSGPDHLLFVLGLVLLVRGWRRLVWTVTAFTAGHSVTLALAVLGVVRIPPQPVEIAIAMTIVVVAVELTRGEVTHETWVRRFPWAMAFGFGLLHGLGFAGALTQIGLPGDEIPLALFAFNLGIELGQLLCVTLILTVKAGLLRVPMHWPVAATRLPAYVIGSLAVFWVVERSAAMF